MTTKNPPRSLCCMVGLFFSLMPALGCDASMLQAAGGVLEINACGTARGDALAHDAATIAAKTTAFHGVRPHGRTRSLDFICDFAISPWQPARALRSAADTMSVHKKRAQFFPLMHSRKARPKAYPEYTQGRMRPSMGASSLTCRSGLNIGRILRERRVALMLH